MDHFESGMKGIGGCGLVISCLCCLSVLAGFVTLTAYLGIYALNNPDAEAWYGTVSGVQTLFPTAEAGASAGSFDLDNVHGNFHIWFLWGFINLASTLGLGLCMGLSAIIPPIAACAMCLLSCTQLSGSAWWIAGMVWRLRTSGSFASGDVVPAGMDEAAWEAKITEEGSLFQYSSGNFMWVYYMICWISMGVCCGCGILVSLCACICGAKHHF